MHQAEHLVAYVQHRPSQHVYKPKRKLKYNMRRFLRVAVETNLDRLRANMRQAIKDAQPLQLKHNTAVPTKGRRILRKKAVRWIFEQKRALDGLRGVSATLKGCIAGDYFSCTFVLR